MLTATPALIALLLAAPAPAPPQNPNWGAIKGRIVWGGKQLPARPILALANHPNAAACQANGPLLDETWVVHPKNKGLRYTFVWLQAPKGQVLPIHPALQNAVLPNVEIDQPFCQFVPHALAIRQGQNVVAKNNSPLAHTVKWSGNPALNPGGNVLLPPNGQMVIAGLVADRLPLSIECNIHPWMKGWLRVFDHPYFAVTDEEGRYEIKNAPVGNWQLMIWHGSGGWRGGVKGKNGQPINLKAGEQTLDDIDYSP
jgi:hypothetical protein